MTARRSKPTRRRKTRRKVTQKLLGKKPGGGSSSLAQNPKVKKLIKNLLGK